MPKTTKEPEANVSVEAIGEMVTNNSIKIVGWDQHPGSSFSKADVPKIGQELQLIVDRDGSVSTEAIIEMARDKRSAMHNYFTWDVQAAAEKCWKKEAVYIRSNIKARVVPIKIIRGKPTEGKEFSTRLLHKVSTVDSDNTEKRIKIYQTLDQIISDPEKKQSVMYDMYKYLMSALSRFNGITELLDDLDQLESIVVSLANRMEIPKKEVRQHIERARGI